MTLLLFMMFIRMHLFVLNECAIYIYNILFFFSLLFSGTPFDVFLHSKPVYGLSVDASNNHIFSTAGEDGRILLFDLRSSSQIISLPKSRNPFHAVQFHPFNGNYIITANSKDGAALWDLRDYEK